MRLYYTLHIIFFHQLIFDTPQLTQFLAHTSNTQPPVEARVVFYNHHVGVTLSGIIPRDFVLTVRCKQSDWQLSSLTQIYSSSLPEAFISTVEHLYINLWHSRWQDDIEDSQWLELLHPFTAVKDLYLSQECTTRIGPALQELAGEVLPSLQNLFLQDQDLHPSRPVQGAIGKFVAARQLLGQSITITVSGW